MAAVIPLKLLYDGTTPTGHSEFRPGDFLPVTHGGSGLAAVAAGDILYGSATNLLAALGIGAADRVLTSSGAAPQWSDILNVTEYRVGGNKIAGARKTGWAVPAGTQTRTSFDPATVTLPELAERVAALIADLHATAGHGLLGT